MWAAGDWGGWDDEGNKIRTGWGRITDSSCERGHGERSALSTQPDDVWEGRGKVEKEEEGKVGGEG